MSDVVPMAWLSIGVLIYALMLYWYLFDEGKYMYTPEGAFVAALIIPLWPFVFAYAAWEFWRNYRELSGGKDA